jgi:hypothetical protein
MRQLSVLLCSILWMSLAHAQNKLEPIRLCVSTIQNSSHSAFDPAWQRNQLIRAFERSNKSKDVAKGKAPVIETIMLDSSSENDPAVSENDCLFILHTNVVEIIDAGTGDLGDPRPHSVGIGSAPNDPGAMSANDNRATVTYRIMRAGEIEPWASGEVREHDPLPDAMLLSHLMDQTASRVVRDLRERH